MKFTVSTASGDPVKNSDKVLMQEEIALTNAEIHTIDYYKIRSKYNQNIELEFNTLEDLLAFSEEHGSIILSGNDITIYDDYVE